LKPKNGSKLQHSNAPSAQNQKPCGIGRPGASPFAGYQGFIAAGIAPAESPFQNIQKMRVCSAWRRGREILRSLQMSNSALEQSTTSFCL
jgi:hypothetical protein